MKPQAFKIIFLDKAGYHKAKALEVPDNIRLVFYLPLTRSLIRWKGSGRI